MSAVTTIGKRRFELPDTTASMPLNTFEFSAAAQQEAAAILSARPDAIFQRLVRDQESEAVFLAARVILGAFLHRADPGADELDPDAIATQVAAAREEIAATLRSACDEPDARDVVLRQRAPLGLLTGCWLDAISQPATQPSVIVNRLFAQHFALRGQGQPQRTVHHLRRRALEGLGIYLPEINAEDFLHRAGARPLTALHGSFYLALSRLPASFLPELVGVHYVVSALGVDDLLTGSAAVLPKPALQEVLDEYFALAGPAERERLRAGVRLALLLEREHVTTLAELALWQRGLSLDAKVAAIIERHGPFAGRQHRDVRIGNRLLADQLSDPDLDLAAFVTEFRASPQVRPSRGGGSRFLRAIKFGGPMFGIFDEHEAAIFTAWVDAAQAGELPEVEISPNRVGDERAREWIEAIARCEPDDVVFADAVSGNDRQLFHRLVNIENFPGTRSVAEQRATRCLAEAEILFTHGAAGRYTDASYFDYSPQALLDRVERIYWDKLVEPYRPLQDIPDREAVIFGQKTFALGSLIDGTWAHRIGGLGRFQRQSDAMLFAIYADEMGRGELHKNHITLIHQVLHSMSVELPHIRDVAFLEQDELPDDLYDFSLHQICLSLFPDSFYNEILGYNLGIEMFGLGELRLHEMQKLRWHRFDVSYEEAHLSIDNISAGHARQSAEIIIAYLDDVRRYCGESVVQHEWRRIWRGYASFAYFVEHELLRTVTDTGSADLLI